MKLGGLQARGEEVDDEQGDEIAGAGDDEDGEVVFGSLESLTDGLGGDHAAY